MAALWVFFSVSGPRTSFGPKTSPPPIPKAGRPVGPLLHGMHTTPGAAPVAMPLRKMTSDERLAADFAGTGLTTGPHAVAYHRAALRREGILSADDLLRCVNHGLVRIAGCVIARQRPGTAKGFVFLSLEDETGIANVIVAPDIFERDRSVVTRSRFLVIEGPLQNQDGVIHVKAQSIAPLDITRAVWLSTDSASLTGNTLPCTIPRTHELRPMRSSAARTASAAQEHPHSFEESIGKIAPRLKGAQANRRPRGANGPEKSRVHPLWGRSGYSSRRRTSGSAASARRAGIHEATKPSKSMVVTTPPRTIGSFCGA